MGNLIPPISSVYVLLGLAFILALLGLATVIIFEIFSGIFNLRGKMLRKAIEGMLGSAIANSFFHHPSYRHRGGRKTRLGSGDMPAYLASNTFVTILLDTICPDLSRPTPFESVEEPSIRQTLQRVWIESAQNPFVFRELLKNWYDENMDYWAGKFQKRVKLMLFIFAFAVCAVFNADIGGLYQRMALSVNSPDPEVLTSVTDNLEKLVKMDSSLLRTDEVAMIKVGLLKNMNQALNSQQIPILGFSVFSKDFNFWDILIWLYGIAFTALIVGWIAPVWFDLMKRFFSAHKQVVQPDTASSLPPAPQEVLTRPAPPKQ